MPMFDLHDAAGVMAGDQRLPQSAPRKPTCASTPSTTTHGWETVRLSFLVQRPSHEPGFRLERTEVQGRTIRYAVRAYALDRPEGQRYGAAAKGT